MYKHLLNLLIRLPVNDSEVALSSHLRSQTVVSFLENFRFGTESKRPSLFACLILAIHLNLGGFNSCSGRDRFIGLTASVFALILSLLIIVFSFSFSVGLLASWISRFLSSVWGLSCSGDWFSGDNEDSESTLSTGDSERLVLAASLTLQ